LKVVEGTVEEAAWNADGKLWRKQAQAGDVGKQQQLRDTAAEMDLQKETKKQEKGNQMKEKTKRFNAVGEFFQWGLKPSRINECKVSRELALGPIFRFSFFSSGWRSLPLLGISLSIFFTSF
jgi:hypothetical protein